MCNWIRNMIKIIDFNDLGETVLNIIGEGANTIIERTKIINNINEFLSLQNNPVLTEQMKVMINDIRPKIIEGIQERNLYILDEVGQELDRQMEQYEIGYDLRNNIKENLKCYILFAIQDNDINFYNNLLLECGLNELIINVTEQDNKIENIIQQIQELRVLIGDLRNNISPIKVKSVMPNINDAYKIIQRTEEIEIIDNRFKQGNNVVFLYGQPGIGKTTLAKLYARKCKYEHIYFEKYENSFETTIKKLAKNPRNTSSKEIVEYWGNHPEEAKNTMLIIDNFNEDTLQGSNKKRYTNELQSEFFERLIDAGIHILITTRINVEQNVMEVGAVSKPLELFQNYCGEELNEKEQKVAEDIIKVIHGNTLMTILVASIWKRSNFIKRNEILIELKNCSVKENALKIPRYIDSDNLEEKTLYEQVNAILDFGGILEEEKILLLLANIVLLPLGGIEKEEFLGLLEQETDNDLNRLVNSGWVISEGNVICLHPLVREILLNKQIVTYKKCNVYCKNIGKKIAIEECFENRICYKNFAQEIYSIFSNEKISNIELARLFYSLSDIYDELEERELSTQVADTVIENIELYDNVPIEKARVLSGIAYSWNNNYVDMKELEKADKVLTDAYDILVNMDNGKNQLDYIEAFGKVLSNRGSNNLSKSRCNQRLKNKYLKEAIFWHGKSLEYRKGQKWTFLENTDQDKLIDLNIATSYTTLATDFFDMKDFEKSIENHIEALKIRIKWKNEKGKTVNQQRIVGCVISMYCERLELDEKYLDLVLGYYPELLKLNYKHQNTKSFEQNMKYFMQLKTIILNDRRFEKKMSIVKGIYDDIISWCHTNPELKDKY